MIVGGLIAGLALAAQSLWAGGYAYGAAVENSYEWRVFPVALALGLLPWVAGIGFWLWDRRSQRDLPERIGRVEWVTGTTAAALLIPTFIIVWLVTIP